MAGKAEVTSFTQSWDKTVAWAKSNNIPFNVYYPVYQMDSQRLLSGYPMSEADRINAIQAARGYTAQTPTQQPSPLDLPANIVHNAQDIFTGLAQSFTGGGLLGNIFDTLKNTIEHPSTVYGMFWGPTPTENGKPVQGYWDQNVANFVNHVEAPHTIWSLIPGMSDIAQSLQGRQGLKYMADNPLTSLLDILPMGRVLPKSIAENADAATAAGQTGTTSQAILNRLGVTSDDLKKMDSTQLAYRLFKTLPYGTAKWQAGRELVGPVYDAKGNATGVKPITIGQRINLFRIQHGMGWDQGELLKGMVIKGEKGTKLVMEKLQPVFDAIDSLKKNESKEQAEALQNLAYQAIQKDYRPISEKLDDPRYPDKVKDVLQVVHDYVQQDREIKMQAGQLVTIDTQFGPETFSMKPGASGPIVQRALDLANRAQTALDKASKKFDLLAYRVMNMDRKMNGAFAQLEQRTNAIYSTIRQNEPGMAGIPHSMQPGVPRDVLWSKMVENQSQVIRNLLGLPPAMSAAARRLFPNLPAGIRLTYHDANAMRDLFQPGGLLDQMVKAQKEEDWLALSKFSKKAMDKFNNKTFDHAPTNGPIFQAKKLTEQLHQYAVLRERDQNAMDKLMYGTYHGTPSYGGKFTKTSIAALTKKASEAHQAFLQVAIEHPPDVWANAKTDELVKQIMANEHSAEIVEKGTRYLEREAGFEKTTLQKMREDPRTIVELFVRASKDTFGNGMMPDIDVGLYRELEKNAYDELAVLRAKGHEPEYIPMVSPFDAERLQREGYNVYIGSLRPKSISSTFGKAFEFNSSIFNVGYGLLKDAKEQITNDVMHEYFTEYFQPYLRDVTSTNQQVMHYLQSDIAANAQKVLETGVREKTVDSLIREQVKRMGMISYDPESIFGDGFTVPKLDGEYYINEHLADAVRQGVQKFQFPAQNIYDRGTRIFRFSILGLSPRYTAHIVVGGTALIAYRGHLGMLNKDVLRAGAHVFRTGELPEKVLQEYPDAGEHMTNSAAQEGEAQRVFHAAAGYQQGNWIIREWLDNHGKTATMLNWMQAASQANMKFTRAVVRGQRAIVYLDGTERAMKDGYFTELVPRKKLDANGNEVLNPVTKRPVWEEVEQRREMTPEQAHHEGMKAVAEVMGELRHMTPLERSVFVRIFPFYGWTKHVLTYVLTYPIDHPYRATFLSQIATQQSQDVASGLPTRIQLLTLLGQPDAYGNVSAIDSRITDPLRDTANYASITGFFQSLNPVLSAPIAYLDPQEVFGGNELYPNMSYSQLYGTKQAGPQGNLWNVAEGFVPQLSAADQAFNLSGHYGYLNANGGLARKVYESLNVPFFQIQHINLRQIAAQQEIDRLQVAKADALSAAQTGDMSSLSGYAPDAPIPDPLNPLYTVTPAYIKAMNDYSEAKYGLPMAATTPAPPNPPLR